MICIKSIILALTPDECRRIVNGHQTRIIRKIIPKIKGSYKVYLYCKSSKPLIGTDVRLRNFFECKEDDFDVYNKNTVFKINGNVIGEFICSNDETFGPNSISEYEAEFVDWTDKYRESIDLVHHNFFDGDESYYNITSNEVDEPDNCDLCKKSCMSFYDIKKYIGVGGFKTFYSYNVDSFIVYKEPIPLYKFTKEGDCDGGPRCKKCPYFDKGCEAADIEDDCAAPFDTTEHIPIIYPPHSFCYCEDIGERVFKNVND